MATRIEIVGVDLHDIQVTTAQLQAAEADATRANAILAAERRAHQAVVKLMMLKYGIPEGAQIDFVSGVVTIPDEEKKA